MRNLWLSFAACLTTGALLTSVGIGNAADAREPARPAQTTPAPTLPPPIPPPAPTVPGPGAPPQPTPRVHI